MMTNPSDLFSLAWKIFANVVIFALFLAILGYMLLLAVGLGAIARDAVIRIMP